MSIKVETEEKYCCLQPQRMLETIQELGFIEKENITESDEYFTDIDGKFIGNRTCLRIRKTNGERMEITFKGKSTSLLGKYCKLENNISANINEYDNYVKLFASLGYYSYVTVEKKRLTFEKKDLNYVYSIMLDKLNDVGEFVEFEIMAEQEDAKKEELDIALKKFVNNFSSFNLKEETKPYRDIVANNIYMHYSNKSNLENMYINIDNPLLDYEKDFFKKYKARISNDAGYCVKWNCFKRNRKLDNIVSNYVDEYLDNLILDSKEIFVLNDLLAKLQCTKYYITRANEIFFAHFFAKLSVKIPNVIYISNESMSHIIKNNSVDMHNSTILNTESLKEVISILLIIENNR